MFIAFRFLEPTTRLKNKQINLSAVFDGELTYASLVDALDLVLFFLNGSRRLLRKLSSDNDISMLGDNRIA